MDNVAQHPSRIIELFCRALVGLVCLTVVASFKAQQPTVALTATEVMIPMRDGVRLYTQIYTPTQATEPLPILFLRTPYGIGQLNAGGESRLRSRI